MPQEPPVTPELVGQVLIEGATLTLVLIVITHLLRRHAKQILFAVMLETRPAVADPALRGSAP
jgi:hypothetical protein